MVKIISEVNKNKTGVFTGSYAINPVNNNEIPIWIADYVLMSYGTGSIMAVPAHDERDYEFARRFNLPIKEVISGGDVKNEAFTSKDGTIINSSNDEGLNLNELTIQKGIKTITKWLEDTSNGEGTIEYKLKDWLFSRQRYWGEPIPIIHGKDKVIPLDFSELPLKLPEADKYEPSTSGESPLANIPEWDSLAHFSLISAIEEKFSVAFQAIEIEECVSFSIIKSKLIQKILN